MDSSGPALSAYASETTAHQARTRFFFFAYASKTTDHKARSRLLFFVVVVFFYEIFFNAPKTSVHLVRTRLFFSA